MQVLAGMAAGLGKPHGVTEMMKQKRKNEHGSSSVDISYDEKM